ncbi:hypothetical protein ABO04_00625 [Nitrosomonas sp. HPC101]|nr:hypothetical protein [Nitrosomonas sp. HPC101]
MPGAHKSCLQPGFYSRTNGRNRPIGINRHRKSAKVTKQWYKTKNSPHEHPQKPRVAWHIPEYELYDSVTQARQ